jgi:hypothetical protein
LGKCWSSCDSSCPLPPAHFKKGFAAVFIIAIVLWCGQTEAYHLRNHPLTKAVHHRCLYRRMKGRGTPKRYRRIHIPRDPLYKLLVWWTIFVRSLFEFRYCYLITHNVMRFDDYQRRLQS